MRAYIKNNKLKILDEDTGKIYTLPGIFRTKDKEGMWKEIDGKYIKEGDEIVINIDVHNTSDALKDSDFILPGEPIKLYR